MTKEKTASSRYRWLILMVLNIAMFGNYYVYDSISPVADVFREQLHFSDQQIGLLNAIYSIPNIFMVLVGGIVVDRLGTRWATFIFAPLCLLGSILLVLTPNAAVMITGRLLFGLGAESLIVGLTAAIVKWFRGANLSFAMGFNLGIARLGSVAAFNSPFWAAKLYENWRGPLLLSLAMCALSVLAAAAYGVLEWRREKTHQGRQAKGTQKIILKDILKFGRSYWLLAALCFTFFSSMFPFQTFAVKFFIDAHGTSRETGGFLTSMPELVAIVLTPLFGWFVDKFGKRALLMMVGSLLLVPVYLFLPSAGISPFLLMAVMAVGFAMVPAILWPSVAYLVKPAQFGTAFGLIVSIQNLGLATFNSVAGYVNDAAGAGPVNPAGYVPALWIFASLAFLGGLCAFLLRQSESGPKGHGLEAPENSKA